MADTRSRTKAASGSAGSESKPRRRRDRPQTEADLRAAARELLDSQGALAGLNLREVAARAGVNRGQIYQYYGSRQALLRAAISDILTTSAPNPAGHFDLPFAERRRRVFQWALGEPDLVKYEALLALDGDEELSIVPFFEQTLEAIEHDYAHGDLAPDVDGVAAHIMTAATYMGYCIFREVFARNVEIPISELDERVSRLYDRMLQGLEGSAAAAAE